MQYESGFRDNLCRLSVTASNFRKIRELIFSKYLDLYPLERYRHRLSIAGVPLYYFAVAARKNADVPAEWMDRYID